MVYDEEGTHTGRHVSLYEGSGAVSATTLEEGPGRRVRRRGAVGLRE